MNKRKKALINTLSNLIFTTINLIVTFFVTRLVLKTYGSDYNGLNSTITQLVSVMLIVESGFALSANVALYKPIADNDKQKIESILSAVNYVFRYVSLIFFCLGIVFTFIVPLFIKTSVAYFDVVKIFVLTFVPIGLRLLIAIKYTTFFESTQQNYIVNLTKIIASILTLISTFFITWLGSDYIALKFWHFLWNILSTVLLLGIFKKKYSHYNIYVNKDISEIKGIKDVLIKKITSVASASFPAIILGILLGTNYVSVYGVYILVLNGVGQFTEAFISGPKDSLGILINEGDMIRTKKIFSRYSFIVISISSILFAVTAILIIPFIKLYTRDVQDINYVRPLFSYLMVFAAFIGAIQGPFTNLLNGASLFRGPMKIQVVGSVALILLSIPLILFYDLTGLAFAILVGNSIVTVGKIILTYVCFFKSEIKNLIKVIGFVTIPQIIFVLVFNIFPIFSLLNIEINTYLAFIYAGIITTLLSSALFVFGSLIPYKAEYRYYFRKMRKN